MKKVLFGLMIVSAFAVNAFAAKPCSQDKYTTKRVKEILAEDSDLKSLEMTDAKGAVTAFLLLDQKTGIAESLFVCGTITHLYYGESQLQSWVSEDAGEIKTISTFSDSVLSQDEGLFSAEALTVSKTDKQAKLKIYYMILNLADGDVEDRGELFLTVDLK